MPIRISVFTAVNTIVSQRIAGSLLSPAAVVQAIRCVSYKQPSQARPSFVQRHTPLPIGYTVYPRHNDVPLPDESAHTMARIIESMHKDDLKLPRTSIFDYLFPPKVKGKRTLYYPNPNPGGKAYIDGLTGKVVTRGEVELQARQLATGLKSLGMKRGDVVCIFGMNSLEWINALFGSQAAGLIVSPASYGYSPPELLHQIKDSTASLVFVSPALYTTLKKALELPEAPKIAPERIILLCSKDAKPDDPAVKDFRCIDEIYGKALNPKRLNAGEETTTAYLCYSSGTTGRAKGVETSHHNITSQIQALNEVYEPLKAGQDVVLGILPFSHIYGLSVVLHQPLTQGVPVVVLPRFEEASVLNAIERYKITWGLIVPPILLALMHSKNVRTGTLRSVRGFMCGAAPLGPELTAAFEAKFPWITITQGYGLTETSPVVNVMTLEGSRGHSGQVGRLMPTFQARLVDAETGKDVEKGERGELWVRGPSVMKGYWRNEEATKNTFADGGWFKTGDVAVVANDGYFAIVDRVKELIKYKGFQVPPAELEALLLSHSEVADVAVIGVYSKDQATELPRAYVVPAGGVQALKSDEEKKAFEQKIVKWVEGKVAHYKYLRGGVVLMEAIPKSPSGKILRKELRALVKKEEEDGVKASRQSKL